MIRNRNIDEDAYIDPHKIAGEMFADRRVVYSVAKSTDGSAVPYGWYEPRLPIDKLHGSISSAYNAATSGQNDVIYLTPESHSQSAALTWAKNLTHLVGLSPPAYMNQRSRIGHSSANVSPLLTVSGYGNMFQNLFLQYGRGAAANLNALTISGDRNSFIRCHVGGPMNATEGDQANFRLVTLNCGEVYFEKCFFGVDTVAWTNGAMFKFYGPADRSTRAVFKDCIFMMNADNNQVRFIETVAGNGAGVSVFMNCQFINMGTALGFAINDAGLGNQKFYFDANCCFSGVSYIVQAAKEANILVGHGGYVASAVSNLIGGTADYS